MPATLAFATGEAFLETTAVPMHQDLTTSEPTSAGTIDIVVVPRDRFSMFPPCLRALYTHTDLPFRLIVVAGAADRTTENYLHQLQAREANVTLVLGDRHLMQAEARTLGLRRAKGRYCVVLENDTVVHDAWLGRMLTCMQQEGAAAVMPLILWYRGIHAAGCAFDERELDGCIHFKHRILYTDIRRKQIDYPESHCVLIDRGLLTGDDIFDDVEPFDVDLGLTIRKLGRSAFLEPSAVATYSAPPPLQVGDRCLYKFRWDASSWKSRNVAFEHKWAVTYDASAKVASYRRQELKLGLATWYGARWTVALANLTFSAANRLLSLARRQPYLTGPRRQPDGVPLIDPRPLRMRHPGLRIDRPGNHDSLLDTPRILFVDNQVSDFNDYRLPLALRLRDAGCDVHVALPYEDRVEPIAREGITVHRFHIKRMSLRPLDELRTLISLLRVYRRLRPTLVHHFCLKPSLYGGLAALVCGLPRVVSTFTGLGYLFTAQSPTVRILRGITAAALRISFRHANHVAVFQNASDRDRLVRAKILSAERAVLINGSGVDLSAFTASPEPVGIPVVLMGCRLLWDKGVAEFVAAAARVRQQGTPARFVLVGEPDAGHPSAIPISTLNKWRDAGDVEWLGWRRDMAALLSASHVVCLPSYYGEGIPRVLIEAAAAGRPIIGTESSGCPGIIRHGENGLIVPPRDSEALADAVIRLLHDVSLRRAMGRRGREIVVSSFSLETVIDANCAVYRSLLPGIGRGLPATTATV